jgi:hypothetical protein
LVFEVDVGTKSATLSVLVLSIVTLAPSRVRSFGPGAAGSEPSLVQRSAAAYNRTGRLC